VRGITTNDNWPVAYMDNYQYVLVDTDSKKGSKLINDVVNQNVKFPDEFAENLTLGYTLLRFDDPKIVRRGFEHAKKALEIDPTQSAMNSLRYAANLPAVRKEAIEYIEAFVKDLQENKETYSRQGGYLKRISAGIVALEHLYSLNKRRNPKLAKKYRELSNAFVVERKDMYNKSKW
jgi:hypothetical protein